ncbi:MAG: hypothetical protein RSB23_01300 [Alistipes sp.]
MIRIKYINQQARKSRQEQDPVYTSASHPEDDCLQAGAKQHVPSSANWNE